MEKKIYFSKSTDERLSRYMVVRIIPDNISEGLTGALFSEACDHWQAGDLQSAFRLFLKLAKAGHVESQLNLSFFYGEGLWVPKDVQKEMYWLYKGVDQYDPSAANNIGVICRQRRKYTQAIAWLALAGQYGDGEALYETGEILLEKFGDIKCAKEYLLWAKKTDNYGSICERSLSRVEELLKKLHVSTKISRRTVKKTLSKRAADALYFEASRYWDEGNLQSAFRSFAKAAKAGDRSSQFNLAYFYGKGLWVQKDPQKEMHWLYKGVDQEYSPAVNNIGAIYQQQQKYAQAIAWMALAAHGEMGGGLYEAGKILLEKFGDIKCAKQYLLRAKSKHVWMFGSDRKKNEVLLKKIRSLEKSERKSTVG